MSKQLKNRLKSLLWRAGAMATIACIAYIGDNLHAFDMSPEVIAVAGLILGEITKFLNGYVAETETAILPKKKK